MFLSLGVLFWLEMVVTANVVAFFVNPYKEEALAAAVAAAAEEEESEAAAE